MLTEIVELTVTKKSELHQTLDDKEFIREHLYSGDESSFKRYTKLILANPGIGSFLKYEILTLFLYFPGAVGLALRRLLIKRLFAACGSAPVFGRSLTLRHADNIRLGSNVVLDDYCLLDARGAGEEGIKLADRVMVNRGATIKAKVGAISIGENTGIGANSHIISQGPIHIADNVSIAGGSTVAGGRYDVNLSPDDPTAKSRFTGGPIVIKSNARIGMHSVVLDGVTIGENAIIAPGSVVFDDVPDDAVVIGCPARPLRQRKAKQPDTRPATVPPATAAGQSNSVADSASHSRGIIRQYLEETHYAEFGPGQLSDDSSLFDENVIDSIGLVGIITMLEQSFQIEFDENDLVPEKLSTVAGLASIVDSKNLR